MTTEKAPLTHADTGELTKGDYLSTYVRSTFLLGSF